MAIAHDNASATNVSNPVTVQTTPFTCSGSDRFLVVFTVGDNAATSGISGVTYNGVSLTKLTSNRTSGARAHDVWYLINPASGSNNVVVNRSSSGLIVSGFLSYTGVDQVTGIASATTTNDTSPTTTFSESITTSTNNSWAVCCIREETGVTLSDGTGYTGRLTSDNTIHCGDSNGVINPAGTHTFTGTYSPAPSNDGTIMFEILEAGAAPSASPFSQAVVIM